MLGKDVSCTMEGDTAGPSLFFQQMENDAFFAAHILLEAVMTA